MGLLGSLLTLLVLLAAVVAGGLAIAAWWNRQQPGIYWFAIHVGLISAWSFVGFGSFVAEQAPVTQQLGLAANGISFAATLAWFLFIVTYLGYRRRLTRWVGWGIVFGLGGLYFVLHLTGQQTDLVVNSVGVVEWGSHQVLTTEPAPLGVAVLLAGFSLFFVGLALILDAYVKGRLQAIQASILLVATLVPVTAGLLNAFFLVPDGVPLIPEAAALSVVLYAVAFNRYDLFAFSPATEQIGVERALDELGAGVLVTEDTGTIIRANEPSSELLEWDPEALVGEDISRVLSRFELSVLELPAVIERRGRYYRVDSSPVTDNSATRIGRSVLFTDVTDQRLREQRLDVLNRVLRHNLRNDLQVIKSATEVLVEDLDGENRETATQALRTADDLASTTTKARTVGKLIEQSSSPTQLDLSAVLRTVVEQHRSQFPAVAFSLDCPDECLVEASRSLKLAFDNLIENAAEHTDTDTAQVEITLTETDTDYVVSISDNGSGIATHELRVLENRGETQLKHGSGIGLWAIQWALDKSRAQLSYDTGPDGTVATVRIPRGSQLDV